MTRPSLMDPKRMSILRFLKAGIGLQFYRWAMREIDRLHPDVPKVTRRLHFYEQEWAYFMSRRV